MPKEGLFTTVWKNNESEVGRLFPVVFMLISFGNMMICLGLVLFFQHPAAYALCALLYAAVVATELRFKITSPISISMLFLYIALTVIDYQTERYKGYAGVIVFGWLSFLVGVLLLLKKPFTAFYSNGKGLKKLHYAVSFLWFFCYVLSLMASVVMMPHVSFLIVPYLLCISCGLFAIFLNFFWFGTENEFQHKFLIGEFSFRRVDQDSTDFSRFCDFYARQIYRPDDGNNGKSEQEISEVIAKVERGLGSKSYIFIAEYESQIVGCIRCVVDRGGRPFPLEEDMKVSFDSLRRFGRLLYVGRLAVDPSYRERPDVLNGLFKLFVDLALSKDVAFVMAEGFANRLPTYLKLGFEMLFERSDHRNAVKMSHGYVCHPVFLNFSKLIFNRSEAPVGKYQFSDFINRYLVERWYKRNALTRIFKSSDCWPWRFDVEKIRKIL